MLFGEKDEIRNLSLMFIPLILVLVNAADVLWFSNSSGWLSGVGLYQGGHPAAMLKENWTPPCGGRYE